MELRREDGSRCVNHTLVAGVVEVDKVLLPLGRQRCRVNRIPVVLRSDVAFSRGQVQSWNVVCAVAVLELDRTGPSCQCQKLVSHTDTHDWDLRRLYQLSEVVYTLLAMSWVARTIGNEDAVEVVGDLVDWIVVWEASDARTTAHEAAENVLLDTTVDKSHMEVTNIGVDVEWCFGRDSLDKVDGLGVDIRFVFVGIIFLPKLVLCYASG
jgi:hypothetical protein